MSTQETIMRIATISFFTLVLLFQAVVSPCRAADGDVLWTRAYGGSGNLCVFSSIIQTSDGGYALAGVRASASLQSQSAYLVKTAANGDTIWTRSFGGSQGGYEVNGLLQASDGGFVLGGGYTASGGGNFMFLTKVDASGNQLWSHTYGDGADWAYAIGNTQDGGIVLTGFAHSWGANGEVCLVKTDASGTFSWAKHYGYGWSVGYAVARTADNHFLVAGVTESTNPQVILVKTSADGNPVWTRLYGGAGSSLARSVIETHDGYYLLAGFTSSPGAQYRDAYLVKIDSGGNLQWSHNYSWSSSEQNSEMARGVRETSDGDYLLAGSVLRGDADFPGASIVIKIDPSGTQLWYKQFGFLCAFNSIVQSSGGNYMAAGMSRVAGPDGWEKGWVVCIDDGLTSAAPLESSELGSAKCRFNQTPSNPFERVVALKYQISVATHVQLGVYDVSGRLVAALVDGWQEAGTHEVMFDRSKLASGSYLATLQAGSSTAVRKLVLVK
jgi:hypothetical protein